MSRKLQIDFLRFCGVVLVMINHIVIGFDTSIGKLTYPIRIGGWIGVDLFFVLSGYLVSGLIFKEFKLHGTFNISRFLVRRGFKIYPTYYILLIVSFVLVYYLKPTDRPTIGGLIHESLFISNYFSFNNGHLWSVSVEEQFYILLSIIFLILLRYHKIEFKAFLYTYLGLLLIALSFRTFNYFRYTDYDFYRDYIKSHFRFDALFFGVLLGYVANFHQYIISSLTSSKFRWLFIIFAISFLLTNFLFDRKDHRIISVINLSLNPICFGYLMINLIAYNNPTFLKLISPFARVGKYSYSIYLFHRLFNSIAMRMFKDGGGLYLFSYFFLALAGGIIISKCIEYPLISFREKHFPSLSR